MALFDFHHDHFGCSCGRTDGSHDYFCDSVPAILDEMEYKDFANILQPNSVAGAHLSQVATRDWAPNIPYVKYEGYRKDLFNFFVPNKWNGWNNFYRWKEWGELVSDVSLDPVEAARLMFWGGNIQMHCNCPSYLFHGYKYVFTQLDSAIYPETRFPKITNPTLKVGPGCKHLRKSLKVLPFHLGKFAAAIKETREVIARGGHVAPAPMVDLDAAAAAAAAAAARNAAE